MGYLCAALVSCALGGLMLGMEIMDRRQTRREKRIANACFAWIAGRPFILCECSLATANDPVSLLIQQDAHGVSPKWGATD